MTRIISSAVIIPVVLVALIMGRPVFDGLVLLITAAMALEWRMLTAKDVSGMVGPLSVIAALAPVLLLASHGLIGGMVAAVIAGAALAGLAMIYRWRGPLWIGAGPIVAGFPCLAILWLRALEPGGLYLVIWIVACVVVTDSGAYAAGRLIGGPRLAPRLSPNKTWAGLLGGMAASAGFSLLFAGIADWAVTIELALLGAAMAVIGQIGDLMESATKRHFGVKDTGHLIPGHGGLLDRLDGHALVLPVAAVTIWLAGGGATW